MTRRERFIQAALDLQDSPYIWGSKGPKMFDCSGLVTHCLFKVGGPDWRAFYGSAKLWMTLPETVAPRPGDLVFYGSPERISHVMIWWSDGRVYGAVGGNRDTTTLAIAHAKGARVKFKNQVNYRPGFRGFRILTPLDEGEALNVS